MDAFTRFGTESKFFKFLFIRLSSVFLVQTWFVPDEYWQSLEVAHRLSFGYGSLTWEWVQGIRSLIHPFFIAVIYRYLANLQVDNVFTLVYTPCIFQAIFTAYSEWLFCNVISRKLNSRVVSWFVILQLSSWYMYYVGSRTLGNTVEMNFILIGISNYLDRNRGLFVFCVCISVYMRPTCGAFWFLFVVQFIFSECSWLFSKKGWNTCINCVTIFLTIIFLESWWHERWILVPYEFLEFNVFNNFSSFYGVHPWHWYLSNALPTLTGPMLIPVFISLWQFPKSEKKEMILLILLSSICYIVCHSFIDHKEIRFLTPIVPLLSLLAASSLAKFSGYWKKMAFALLLIWNIPIAWYLCLRHQRGVLDATTFLGSHLSGQDSVLFLMPCHSTPLYSHVHVNASLQFLKCPPNLSRIENYIDEADMFYQQPNAWLEKNIEAPPNYLVFFDVLAKQISNYLTSNNYQLVHNFFHTDLPEGRIGRYVLIFHQSHTFIT